MAKGGSMRCARLVIALFGPLFLIALLSVPVTTTTSSLRTDPYSGIVIRTTHPRNSRVFLARYLSMRAHPPEGQTVRARSLQWSGFMVLIAILGLFDYVVFCRLLRRTRRDGGTAGGEEQEGAADGRCSSGLSLFP